MASPFWPSARAHAGSLQPRAGTPAHVPMFGAAELDHHEVRATLAGVGGLKARSARRVFLYSGHGLRLPAFCEKPFDVRPQPDRAAG